MTAGTLAATGTAAAATRATAHPPAQLYLVHGIPGVTADVLLDGHRIAATLGPRPSSARSSVPAGQHVVTLQDAGRGLTGARFTAVPGQSLDLVAQRGADRARTPQLVVFRNDLQPVGPGKGRLVVAHAAVAPPADVRVDGETLFRDVAPGEALSLLVPARSYAVDVLGSQGSGAILDPVRVSVRAGTLTRVFAVGDPSDGTADAVVQVLTVPVVGAGRPRSVPTGDGGQAAESYVDDGRARVPVGLVGGRRRARPAPPRPRPAAAAAAAARPVAVRAAAVLSRARECGRRPARAGVPEPLRRGPRPHGRPRGRRLRRRPGRGRCPARRCRRPSGRPGPVGSARSSPRRERRGGGGSRAGATHRRGPSAAVGRELPARSDCLRSHPGRAARTVRRRPSCPSGSIADGALVIPEDVRTVGWWTGGSRQVRRSAASSWPVMSTPPPRASGSSPRCAG